MRNYTLAAEVLARHMPPTQHYDQREYIPIVRSKQLVGYVHRDWRPADFWTIPVVEETE